MTDYASLTREQLIERLSALESIRAEQECRTIIQASMDSFWKVGADGRIIDCNEAACTMLGYSREEMLSLCLHDVDAIEDEARAAEHVRWVIAQGHDRFETRHRRKDGSSVAVDVSAHCVPGAGAPLLFAFSRDISARKRAEEALRQSEALLSCSQQIANLGSWKLDVPVNHLEWSDEVFRIFGCEPHEFEATYEAFLGFVHPDDRAAVDAAYTRSVKEGRDRYEIEHRIIRKATSEIRFVHERCVHERDVAGAIIRSIGMVQDITERKRAEEALQHSEAQIRSILRSAPVGIGVQVDRVFQEVNAAFASMTGYAAEELVGRSSRMVYPTDADFESVGREMRSQIREGGIARVETRFRTREGRIIDVAFSAAPIMRGNLSHGVTFAAQDITSIKHVEQERLAREARQRVVLVREVHHRIKNHLQGVIGMLRGMVGEYAEGAQFLEKAIARVRAISQVYGLQGSRGDAQVRLCDLLQTAAEDMAGPVPVICKLPPAGNEAILAPEEAVPLALIVNELLTNALKHLGTVDPQRPVLVTLVIGERMACAEIRNGPARLPPDFDFDRSSKTGTGLELVAALLPPQGSRLEFRQDGDEVVARLELEAPVISTIIRSA
jgi:PAS domain S-box-containing protein